MKKLTQLFAALLFFFFLFTLTNYSQILTTTTLTGHVYAASDSDNDTTATPVPNATVSLHSLIMVGAVNPIPVDSVLYQATTDSTGKFTIKTVMPGRYILMASAAGYETFALNFSSKATRIPRM